MTSIRPMTDDERNRAKEKAEANTLTKDHEKVFKAWVKEGYVNDDTIDNYLYWVGDWYQKEKEKDER